ncbi:hypothetical protein AB1Y20_017392 [Prymnesium parvum]|uniref:Soluble calcium-activated nucleotidase 1 n=1 Tax=Prymnesium parvum TaxID=97485 RepID=A0AB34JMJ4_PRYPA
MGCGRQGSGKYSTLDGTPLPLFARQRAASRSSLRRLLCLGIVVFSLLNALTWHSLLHHQSIASNERMLALRAAPGAPLMTHGEALEAMYPWSADRVPLSHNHSRPCTQQHTILIVADMDRDSRNGSVWESSLRRGSLCLLLNGSYTVDWLDEVPLRSTLNQGGRGMELSTLTWFSGKLLACDDRTGVVYHILGGHPHPEVILADGDGSTAGKGFKCEWASVRHGQLYLGSVGREMTNARNEVLHRNSQYVKVIDSSGSVQHLNWTAQYEALRAAANTSRPGYLWHEAAVWDDLHDRWLFWPRKESREAYNPKDDESRGSNLILTASGSAFETVHYARAGEHIMNRGFSSVKLLPHAPDIAIALRTEEVDGRVASFVCVVHTNGTVLMTDTFIADRKYEGIEVAV